MLFEGVGPYSAIGKIAQAEVEAALNGGWRVTVVAKFLDESLRDRVEWVKLLVPPRGFALQWLTARWCYLYAIGRRLSEFDLVHGHQPQIADLCDVFQCHFLTRVAYERDCLYDRHGWLGALDHLQKRLVMAAEDYFYRRWNPQTLMLFNSMMTQTEFARLYGMPPRQQVFLCPCPAAAPVQDGEKAAVRHRLVGRDWDGIVAGFLGGLQERKGFRRLLRALQGEQDIFLLMGGLYSEGFDPPELSGHFKALGLVDTGEFYTACDVLLLPSQFEPFGLVAFEAAAKGVPTVATREVGALTHLIEGGSGVEWKVEEPLAPLLRAMHEQRREFEGACLSWARAHSYSHHEEALLRIYGNHLCTPLRTREPATASPVQER